MAVQTERAESSMLRRDRFSNVIDYHYVLQQPMAVSNTGTINIMRLSGKHNMQLRVELNGPVCVPFCSCNT